MRTTLDEYSLTHIFDVDAFPTTYRYQAQSIPSI